MANDQLFPREPSKKGGWTMEYEYLQKIQNEINALCPEDLPDLEAIESVLIAIEKIEFSPDCKTGDE